MSPNLLATGAASDHTTGQAAVERDKFLSPAEAKEFGLIDEVVENRPGAPE